MFITICYYFTKIYVRDGFESTHKWTLFGEVKVNRRIKKDMGQGLMPYTRLSVLFHL